MTNRRIAKDWLDAYLDYGVDLQNRRVWLVGEITEDSTLAAIKGLYLLDTINRDPCELFISSPGGDLVEALAIVDVIGTLGCDVYTFAFGKCMSAAPLILAAGTPEHRWVATHTVFMAHDYSSELPESKGAQLRADVEEGERVLGLWLDAMAARTTKPIAFWRGLVRKPVDYYYTANEAIEWGVADAIWSER